MNNSNLTILHAFDPKKILPRRKKDEVTFIQGKYIDIANTKGKNKNSLYFGTSCNSNLLTGIFLGDLELTSRVKDISILNNGDTVSLCIKYINNANKLATLKGKLPSTKAVTDITNQLKDINKHFKQLDSSVSNIEKEIKNLDSSVSELYNNDYTIHETVGPFNEGYKKTYTLFKGENEQTNSSVILLNDYTLKKLEYDVSTNSIIAISWPDACEDIYLSEEYTDIDGNIIKVHTDKLNDEYIKTLSLNLESYDEHLLDRINTDSSINDRLTYVENQLKWEKLLNQ